MGFPGDSVGEESACIVGDLGSAPGLERSGGGHGNPLWILAWRIPLDRGAWRATVHGVPKSQTGLSDSAQLLWCRTVAINYNTVHVTTGNVAHWSGGWRSSLAHPIYYIVRSELPREELNTDFPTGPVAKTPHSQCRGPGFYPCSWN